jgi:hypothetical protein
MGDDMKQMATPKVPVIKIVWCTFTPNDTTDSVGRKRENEDFHF